MFYGYKTNKKFIEKVDKLLRELNKRKLWNKGTLIIGLDKSVRPLAYTLGKLSREKGMQTPEVRFFNYTSHDEISNSGIEKITDYFKSKIDPEEFSKYKEIIILDDHIYSGNSLKNTKKILENYLSKEKIKKNIHMAILGPISGISGAIKGLNDFIFVDKNLELITEMDFKTGVEDKINTSKLPYGVNESKRVHNSSGSLYPLFSQKRIQLREDIKNYVNKGQTSNENVGNSPLEKIIRTSSFIFLISGILIGSNQITGNIIGNPITNSNFIGAGLILIGIAGLFISRKFKN